MIFVFLLLATAGLYIFYSIAGRVNTVMAIAMSTMCFLPRVLYGGSLADMTRSGISSSEPRIMTYTAGIAIIAGFAALMGRSSRANWPFFPFVAFLLFCYFFVWEQTGEVHAGMVHFLTAAAAWAAGAFAASCVERDQKSGRQFIYWIFAVVFLQLVISILQYSGLQLFPTNAETSELVGSRVNGSFSHPTALGKVLLLFFMVCLPFTRSTDRRTRFSAWAIVAMSFPMLVLSGGRANFFSAVVMILLWTLLLPRGHAIASKLAIPLAMAVVAFASAGVWAARFEEDPEGSTRQHFNDVAMALIPANPVTGTGPNTYITTAGPTDALTAQGWPVHNSVLLAAVEIGTLGAALLFIPLLVVFSRAWRQRRDDSVTGDFGRAYIASLPGIALVALTGWGMMGDVLSLWLFLAAFSYRQLLGKRIEGSCPAPATNEASRERIG